MIQPAQTSHFKPLDGLRGLAILLVLLLHTFVYNGSFPLGRALRTFAEAGWVGVTLFFVLSGYLISGILLDTRDRRHYLRDFYARRSLRIFPLYFGFLAFYFFLLPHLGQTLQCLNQPAPSEKLYYWTYTENMQGFFHGHRTNVIPLNPFWSLSTEEQVYLFWPFMILLIPRRRLGAALVAIAILSLGWRLFAQLTGKPFDWAYSWTLADVEAFAAGAMVALLSRQRPAWVYNYAHRAAAGSGGLLIAFLVSYRHFSFVQAPLEILTFGTTIVVIFFAATIGTMISCSERSLINRIFSASWLRMLGKYSYAIYLFHGSFTLLLGAVMFSKPEDFAQDGSFQKATVFFLGVVGCSYLAAFVSWHLWESRFLKLKRYFPSSSTVALPSSH